MQTFRQSETDIIDPETEMHYAILSSFQNTKFPHSHDFFEFFLLVEGTQLLHINNYSLTLTPGSLVLIRPNDVHERKYLSSGYHINIAFSAKIANAMFEYLGNGYPSQKLLHSDLPPYLVLSKAESAQIHSRMDKLYSIRMKDTNLQRTELRILIIHIFVYYFSRCFDSTLNSKNWFDSLLNEMSSPKNFTLGLPAMIKVSGKSHEHLCRIFKKNLDCTPTQYINELKLNYAANFLLHSDLAIIDICMNAGFDNISHFYHLFKNKFAMTPHKFRKSHINYE